MQCATTKESSSFYVLVCPANLHRQMFGALRGDIHSPYHRTSLPFHRPGGMLDTCGCRLLSKTAHRPETKVNRAWSEIARIQMHSVPDAHGFAERQSRLGAIPLHEFVDCVPVATLSIGAGNAVEAADFATSRSGNRRIDFPPSRFPLQWGFRCMTCGLQTPQVMIG